MKKVITFILFIAIGFVAIMILMRSVQLKNPNPEPESQQARRLRYSLDAEPVMLESISNRITGLRRVFDIVVHETGDETYEWFGTATAEFTNHTGGVESTNLYFRFLEDTWTSPEEYGRLFCIPMSAARYHAHYAPGLTGSER